MSTRALRKLQREQEIEKQVAAVKAAYEEQEDSEEEEVPAESISQPRNAFDMLNDVNEDNDEDDETDDKEVDAAIHNDEAPTQPRPLQTNKSRKKKKQKKKNKEKQTQVIDNAESEDEIDRALKELNLKGDSSHIRGDSITTPWEATATKLLAIEPKNLNPTNEMRSLFGNIALENHESRGTPRTQRRRDANAQGGVDLATALTGRYSAASRGKELGMLATRRNCLMQGREEWPLATSGGLSMEHLQSDGFESRYQIIHNQTYQQIQMQFRVTVESMQADRMIGLLTGNPYHIATLLQVSEIAKHQGDHSVSGDLLERALFSIGRSVHSSFPAATREGNARLDFNTSTNRELYLTVWRYIRNLEMRGTWRTAFEWSKLLLQFDTLSDPYGITMMIDQLALRGRQPEQLIDLASEEAYGKAWYHLPNIQISLALAFLKSSKPKDARRQLAIAMHKYPYILSGLASALDISPLPKALWAKLPSTDAEKLYTELYISQAKDLWNTPETTSLIVEVAETLSHYKHDTDSVAVAPKLEISLEEARHIMLLEIPALIALLPRKFTTMPTSSSDVLPPPSSSSDFTARAPVGAGAGGLSAQDVFAAAGAPVRGATQVLQQILNWFQSPVNRSDTTNANEGAATGGEAAFQLLREQIQQENPGLDVTDDIMNQVLQSHLEHTTFDDDQAANPTRFPMAGAWDYPSEAEDEVESGVEGADHDAGSDRPASSFVTTVEDIPDSDDEREARLNMAPGHGILRRVDSDEGTEANRPSATEQPPVRSAPGNQASTVDPTSQPTSSNEDDISITTDPQRLQRWLITTGLATLQPSPTPQALHFFVGRLRVLRKQQQDWVLNIIQQRAGKDLVDSIRRSG